MQTDPIEQLPKDRLMERLRYATVEALYRQGLLDDAQRRALCAALQCEAGGDGDDRR